jgi:hypothetical protein
MRRRRHAVVRPVPPSLPWSRSWARGWRAVQLRVNGARRTYRVRGHEKKRLGAERRAWIRARAREAMRELQLQAHFYDFVVVQEPNAD